MNKIIVITRARVHLNDINGTGYAYYEDLTSFDLSPGKWIKIEPQGTIDRQGDEDWIRQWNIKMAIEIDYEKATS